MSKYKHIIERMNQKKFSAGEETEETKEKEAMKMQEESLEIDENLLQKEKIDAQSIEDEIRKHWAEKEKQEEDISNGSEEIIYIEPFDELKEQEEKEATIIKNIEIEKLILQENLQKKEEQLRIFQEKFESMEAQKEEQDTIASQESRNQMILSEKEEEIRQIKMQLNKLRSEKEKLIQDRQRESVEKKRLQENVIAIEDMRKQEEERAKILEQEKEQLKIALEKGAEYKKESETAYRILEDKKKVLEETVAENKKILTEKENALLMLHSKNQQMKEENSRIKMELEKIKESGTERFIHLFYSSLKGVGTSSCAIDLAYRIGEEEEVIVLDLNSADAVGMRAYFSTESVENGYEEIFCNCILMKNVDSVDQKAFFRKEKICVFTPPHSTRKKILIHQLLSFLNYFRKKQVIIDISGENSMVLETLLSLQNIHKYFVIQNDDYTAHRAIDDLIFSRDEMYAGWNLVINKANNVHPRVLDIIRSKMTLNRVISIPEADRIELKKEKQSFRFKGFHGMDQKDLQNKRRKI